MSIKSVQECRSNDGWQPIKVDSASRPGSYYTVWTAVWLDPIDFICECESYDFRERCRHQKEAADKLCGWVETIGPEEQDDAQRRGKICPRCGEATAKRVAVD